jgi:hypothetical protein
MVGGWSVCIEGIATYTDNNTFFQIFGSEDQKIVDRLLPQTFNFVIPNTFVGNAG